MPHPISLHKHILALKISKNLHFLTSFPLPPTSAYVTYEWSPKAKEKAEEDKRLRELSEEEKQVIVMSEDFQRFFDRSTRLVERAIWEEPNVFIDYTGTFRGGN